MALWHGHQLLSDIMCFTWSCEAAWRGVLGMVTCRDMDALRETKLDNGEGPMISLILHL